MRKVVRLHTKLEHIIGNRKQELNTGCGPRTLFVAVR